MRLYRTVHTQWFDPWGFAHPAQIVIEYTAVTKTDRMIDFDNGYQKGKTPIWEDEDGREFCNPPSIDYWGGPWKMIDAPSDGMRWWTDRLHGRVVSVVGEPIRLDSGHPVY